MSGSVARRTIRPESPTSVPARDASATTPAKWASDEARASIWAWMSCSRSAKLSLFQVDASSMSMSSVLDSPLRTTVSLNRASAERRPTRGTISPVVVRARLVLMVTPAPEFRSSPRLEASVNAVAASPSFTPRVKSKLPVAVRDTAPSVTMDPRGARLMLKSRGTSIPSG